MILLSNEPAIVSAFVSGQTGDQYTDVMRALGILSREGRIIGGVLLTNYTGFGVELTLAGRGCISRTAWQAIGDLAFGDLGCQRISVTTRKSNKRVCKLAPRLKFKFEGIARKYYGKEDGVMFSLLRDEAIQHGYWKEA
ncbi:N-acetyltransferase [Sinorhizobium meliloti]|uniref:GNAT family N-acetyltransferase n=1 Tax=Rhizobium meliloti TaxID=382 RepID=UPI000FD27B93|nr:GNAT family protein [Sinorhizobium meliloti]RVL48485.1 N-acetyltransferase [Sinorhizobium meliloti]RVL72418.1 N-acetyltransferase [Sinorhizobium meliloti]